MSHSPVASHHGPAERVAVTLFERICPLVYWAMLINLALVVVAAPLLATLVLVRTWFFWPLVLLSAGLFGPALKGAFTCFDAYQESGDIRVARDFWRGWRSGWVRSYGLAVAAGAIVGACVADVFYLGRFPWAGLVAPAIVVVAALVVLITVSQLALTVLLPELGWARSFRLAGFGVIRRWPISLVTLVVVSVGAWLVAVGGWLAALVVPAVVLFITWANVQCLVREALPQRGGLKPLAGRSPFRTSD
ncbi:MAG: DUF624 domain-containing protein [Propionibacteriaceae bacterium]|jgi:uncharacterized membrane protein YesL|nr:DUF624 domain-containing protein [Propionibacteriaceae bacterium]